MVEIGGGGGGGGVQEYTSAGVGGIALAFISHFYHLLKKKILFQHKLDIITI